MAGDFLYFLLSPSRAIESKMILLEKAVFISCIPP